MGVGSLAEWTTSYWPGCMLMLLGSINGICFFLFKRLTPEGQAIMDDLRFLKVHLSTGPDGVAAASPSDQDASEPLDELLPYAVALGVEAGWSARFKEVFADISVEWEWGGYYRIGPFWYRW